MGEIISNQSWIKPEWRFAPKLKPDNPATQNVFLAFYFGVRRYPGAQCLWVPPGCFHKWPVTRPAEPILGMFGGAMGTPLGVSDRATIPSMGTWPSPATHNFHGDAASVWFKSEYDWTWTIGIIHNYRTTSMIRIILRWKIYDAGTPSKKWWLYMVIALYMVIIDQKCIIHHCQQLFPITIYDNNHKHV